MDIPLQTVVLSYLLVYILGIGSGLLVCCRWKSKFMSRSSSSMGSGCGMPTVAGRPLEPQPVIHEIKLTNQ